MGTTPGFGMFQTARSRYRVCAGCACVYRSTLTYFRDLRPLRHPALFPRSFQDSTAVFWKWRSVSVAQTSTEIDARSTELVGVDERVRCLLPAWRVLPHVRSREDRTDR